MVAEFSVTVFLVTCGTDGFMAGVTTVCVALYSLVLIESFDRTA